MCRRGRRLRVARDVRARARGARGRAGPLRAARPRGRGRAGVPPAPEGRAVRRRRDPVRRPAHRALRGGQRGGRVRRGLGLHVAPLHHHRAPGRRPATCTARGCGWSAAPSCSRRAPARCCGRSWTRSSTTTRRSSRAWRATSRRSSRRCSAAPPRRPSGSTSCAARRRDFYRAVHPLLAPLDAIERGAYAPIGAELRTYFRDVNDHLKLVDEEVVAQRDLLAVILQANMAVVSVEQTQISVRQNETAKQLTLIATIFLPLTFVTGFFGQNFGWLVRSHRPVLGVRGVRRWGAGGLGDRAAAVPASGGVDLALRANCGWVGERFDRPSMHNVGRSRFSASDPDVVGRSGMHNVGMGVRRRDPDVEHPMLDGQRRDPLPGRRTPDVDHATPESTRTQPPFTRRATEPLAVDGDLDQVPVGIAEVHAVHRPQRARPLDRPELDQSPSSAAIASIGPSAMKHRSALPGAGAAAFGSNSAPAWWRLIFWAPKASARRPSPNVCASIPSTRCRTRSSRRCRRR